MSICPYCNSEVFVGNVIVRCLRCLRDLEVKSLKQPVNLRRKGKVILATIHGRTHIEGAHKHLFAVGKPKGSTYFQWWEHKPGLAPSRDLVTFTKEHNRKGHLDGWFERYTESLIDEWLSREDSKLEFNELIGDLNNGLTVAIACYCNHNKREFCHLSVLRDLLEDMGYEVEEAEPIKYKW